MPRLILRASLVYLIVLAVLALVMIASVPFTIFVTYLAPGSRFWRKWIEH
jgi:hypothetical protein